MKRTPRIAGAAPTRSGAGMMINDPERRKMVGKSRSARPQTAAGSAAGQPAAVKPSRHTRSRESTRRKMIDAALTVIAKKGLDNTTIADITSEADVGFGSFYNHFKSKSEIAEAAFEARAENLALIGDLIADREKDAATAVAYIQRVFLTKAVQDPVWGWFIIHASNGLPQMGRVFMHHGARDIKRGQEQGRFDVANEETAMRIILSSLLGMMRAILEDQAPSTSVHETIECLLRMLGLEAAEARELSRKELPAYVVRMFEADAR
jgi:AcrR family transcriptional regulator